MILRNLPSKVFFAFTCVIVLLIIIKSLSPSEEHVGRREKSDHGGGGSGDHSSHLPIASSEKVNLTLFYEVLCPDSVNFVLRQLYPTWELLSDFMRIDYVPYGKASFQFDSASNRYEFTCQHGPEECRGNMVHACAVKHVPEPTKYIRCMIENASDDQIGSKCARHFHINWEEVRACAEGIEGNHLLAEQGRRTEAVREKVKFVPTIALNGDFGRQREILKELTVEVCRVFKDAPPASCPVSPP